MSAGGSRRTSIRVVPLPLPVALRSGIHDIRTIYNIVVELDDDGCTGTGYTFMFGEREARAIREITEDLFEVVADRDWSDVVGARRAMWQAINHAGQAGLAVAALAAVDTALWDLAGRRAGVPLHRLWGAAAAPIPAYASGGWLSYSIDTLLAEAAEFAETGFVAYKMKVGGPDQAVDLDRVARVQDAVGATMTVMVDANQAYSRSEALRMGRRLQDLGVDWFEEPVDALDLEGAAQVAAALDIRVAAGETVFGVSGLLDIVRTKAADVVMPDLAKCGGVTAVRQAIGVCDAFSIEVSPHLYPEIMGHVLATSDAKRKLVEYLPAWWRGFLVEAPRLENGHLLLSEAPGLGIRVDPDLPHL
jgi:L-alanine-DL-glutamate epimerase-like enolase superfamily enzyme